MSGRSLDDFLADQAAFDALNDEDKARLFAGETLEGETNAEQPAEESSKAPEAAPIEEEPKEAEPQKADPVVLAKDGVHTIPYAELEAARERARQLEQQLEQERAAKAKPTQAEPEPQAEEPVKPESMADLVRERDEAMFAGDTEKASELSLKIIEIQEERASAKAYARLKSEMEADRAQQSQRSAMQDAQERADALVKQYDFLNPNSSKVNQDAIDLVVAQRDRLIAQGVPLAQAIGDAVAKVAPLFAPKTEPADVATKAAEAVQKAKGRVPTSLSQIPAGATAHHDEGEAIREMTGMSLINRFMNKTPDQINELLAKAI